MSSDVRYALNGDVHIAYRVLGDGPIDVMFIPTWVSNLDLLEEYGPIQRYFDRLSTFARVIIIDRRGAGLSDRLCGAATLEEGIDDILAVMDDAGSQQPALLGLNESGPMCALFAATHPTRVSSLILYSSFATTTWKPDYPWGTKPDEREQEIQFVIANWGEEIMAYTLNPNAGDDPQFRRWAMRWQRNSISRDALRSVFDTIAKTDVRHVLETIQVPTLVLHREHDMVVPVDNGRYLAEKIPNAKYVELSGSESLPFLGDWEAIVEELEEFLTGQRRHRSEERVLATIMFADIVNSTEKAARIGDDRWNQLLDQYERNLIKHLERHRGRLVKSLGDGHLATFDGPARAIRCAFTLKNIAKRLDIDVRAGLHTGEVDTRGDDVSGIAVHIGARVCNLAEAGEVFVSAAMPPLVAGSGIEFEDAGEHELKGVPGPWRIFRVTSC